MEWETVIGLEVHTQLNTKTKVFCGCSTEFGAEPNAHTCPVCLAMPGSLPVLNKVAVEKAVRFGLAINAKINRTSVFARKNYFYPDLPKGYQISQFELPIVGEGELFIDLDEGGGNIKRVGITRAHMEEDAGKSLHEGFTEESGIDLNRAGTPLLEIVSEPDLRSSSEAVAYLKKLHALVRYLDISDGNMQEGSFRCDANVSIRRPGAPLGTRCEIKNLNSFKFLEKAIEFEVERQIDLIESGGKVVQETRLFDSVKNETRSMRSKEEAFDYRYFPDPDLLPLVVQEDDIERLRGTLPELPDDKRLRFQEQYALSAYDAGVVTVSRAMADYFETVAAKVKDAKLAANWIMGDLTGALNKAGLEIGTCPVPAEELAAMIGRIEDNTISGKIAKEVFDILFTEGGTADAIIEAKGLRKISDPSAIEAIIDEIMAANPAQVEQYRSGKDKVFGFFVGQVMRASKGKADPALVNDLLKSKLDG